MGVGGKEKRNREISGEGEAVSVVAERLCLPKIHLSFKKRQ